MPIDFPFGLDGPDPLLLDKASRYSRQILRGEVKAQESLVELLAVQIMHADRDRKRDDAFVSYKEHLTNAKARVSKMKALVPKTGMPVDILDALNPLLATVIKCEKRLGSLGERFHIKRKKRGPVSGVHVKFRLGCCVELLLQDAKSQRGEALEAKEATYILSHLIRNLDKKFQLSFCRGLVRSTEKLSFNVDSLRKYHREAKKIAGLIGHKYELCTYSSGWFGIVERERQGSAAEEYEPGAGSFYPQEIEFFRKLVAKPNISS